MEQAWQTSFAIVNHIAGDLKTTPESQQPARLRGNSAFAHLESVDTEAI
jgi:hypothetical protein